MNTDAPELRALIIIRGSAGPVISTRRSSRSAGAGATCHVAARMSAVAARKPGRSPASMRAWRSARRPSRADALVAEPALEITQERGRLRGQDLVGTGDIGAVDLDPRREPGHATGHAPADRRTVASIMP